MIKLNIDAMGGDNGVRVTVPACVDAISENRQLELNLFGDEQAILSQLEALTYDKTRLHIIHAPEIIDNDEAPVLAIRRKNNASVVRAMNSLADGEADGFVGAGSTGAVLAGATLLVKRLPGIMRPALSPLLPTLTGGHVALIDCGANVDSKPEWLAQFALMGSVYMNKVLHVKNPRVAILNNGTEAHKGDSLVKEAYGRIAEMPVNFVGSVEAREILSGDVDVVVSDGFVGNVALKSIEGTAKMMATLLKQAVMQNRRRKIGGLLLRRALREFRTKMDYTEHGGAPLLGVQKCIIKAHGSSNTRAFYHAIRQCYSMVEGAVPTTIEKELSSHLANDTQINK